MLIPSSFVPRGWSSGCPRGGRDLVRQIHDDVDTGEDDLHAGQRPGGRGGGGGRVRGRRGSGPLPFDRRHSSGSPNRRASCWPRGTSASFRRPDSTAARGRRRAWWYKAPGPWNRIPRQERRLRPAGTGAGCRRASGLALAGGHIAGQGRLAVGVAHALEEAALSRGTESLGRRGDEELADVALGRAAISVGGALLETPGCLAARRHASRSGRADVHVVARFHEAIAARITVTRLVVAPRT